MLITNTTTVKADDEILLGSGSVQLIDTSRDDQMYDGFDVLKWSQTTAGVVTDLSTQDGFISKIGSSGTSNSYSQLESVGVYQDACVSIDYSLLHLYDVDVSTASITYALLELRAASTARMGIGRYYIPGIGHQAIAYAIDSSGTVISMGSIKCLSGSGTLRVLKFGAESVMLHNNTIVARASMDDIGTANVRVTSEVNTVGTFIEVMLNNYVSAVGYEFSGILGKASFSTVDRIVMSAPTVSETTQDQISVFNHDGFLDMSGQITIANPGGITLDAAHKYSVTNDATLR